MSDQPGVYHSPIRLSPREQAALDAVRPRLAAVEGSSKFLLEAAAPPVAGSRRDAANNADLRDAYEQAGALLFASEDHLRTVHTVVQSDQLPSYALYTLLRVAAEAEVRCRHLLDPAIVETNRLAHGLNERLDNLIEQRKASGDLAFFQTRVAHLEKRALANGVTPIRSQTKSGALGEITGFGEPSKSGLELFDLYLRSGSTAFRFLGGHVHSKPWVQLPWHRARPTSDPKVSMIPTDLNVVLFASVLDSVLRVRDLNVRAWLTLSGYPSDLWAQAKGTT